MSEISNLVVVGLNYRTAPLDIRQSVYFNTDQLEPCLKSLSSRPEIIEALIISTCNRVEILSNVENLENGIQTIESFLTEFSELSPLILHPKLYRFSGLQTVRHIFRLASSLDSMILGEPQILGQLKSFYTRAVTADTVGFYLNSLVQTAFRVAKRVRTETSVGKNPVSAGSAAAELARNIFGDLRDKKILIVGAGKMGEAAVTHLHDEGVQKIYVMNRTRTAAEELAGRFHGIAVPFSELRSCIPLVDIVIVSTGSSDILIDYAMVQDTIRDRRSSPLVFIDISALCNVDPDVGKLADVFYYNIDDLGSVVETNLNQRVKAAANAEKIIDEEVRKFMSKVRFSKAAPMISLLQQRVEELCRDEFGRCLNRIEPPSPEDRKELELMVTRIAAKIAHPLLVGLRKKSDSGDDAICADLIRELFPDNR
jgi:glutamyl-tRNA reductase